MTRQRIGALLAAVVGLVVVGELSGTQPVLLGGGEAHAVVGRPLTPMSYAGVARRTTRRAAYAGAAVASTYPVGTVTALPGGCAFVGGIYRCGAVAYRPVYDGPTVVYVRQ
jgi:hypothetical protein